MSGLHLSGKILTKKKHNVEFDIQREFNMKITFNDLFELLN